MKKLFPILAFLFASLTAQAQAVSTASTRITVNGAGFVPGSVVVQEGVNCPTTFVSSTQLTANCAEQALVINPNAACTVAQPNVWAASVFATQTGNFEIQFDATPSASNMDGVFGISAIAESAYTTIAIPLRFNSSGFIDAMASNNYQSVQPIPYVGGTTYHFTVDVNFTLQSYRAYVGTSPRLILASRYGFRASAGATPSLSAFSILNDLGAGTISICNVNILPIGHVASLRWNASVGAINYQLYRSTVSGGPYLYLVGTTTGTSFTDTTVLGNGTFYYVVQASNANGPSANSNEFSVTVP